jgi:hypothetical protein
MNHNWQELPSEHPAIMAIALDLILHPEYRARYSAVVLRLVDEAIAKIKVCLQDGTNT